MRLFEKTQAAFYFPGFDAVPIPGGLPFNREKVPLKEVSIAVAGTESVLSCTGTFGFSDTVNLKPFLASLRTFIVWLMRSARVDRFTERMNIKSSPDTVSCSFSPCTSEEVKNMFAIFINKITW
jgi:hypothetical protein